MVKRLKLYVETSVWNFYFADDAPEKKDITRQFFLQVQKGTYEIYISGVVLREIAQATEEKQTMLFHLITEFSPRILEVTEEIVRIAEAYIRDGVLPERAIDDSRHIAIATFYELDAVISWNLKHIANLKKMERINTINVRKGYIKTLVLTSPLEVSNE